MKQVKRVPIQVRIPIISDKQHECPYEKPFGYIYKVTNKVNGCYYIGKHKFNKPYIDKKYKGSGKILYRAYDKYGVNNFDTIIIDWAKDLTQLNQLEKFWINMFNSQIFPFHYNISDGGDGGITWGDGDNPFKGHKHTEYSKKLISQNNHFIGKHLEKEHVDKLVACHKDKQQSESHRANLSVSHMNKTHTIATKTYISNIVRNQGGRSIKGAFLPKPVVQLSLSGEFIKEWKSIAELKRAGFDKDKMWKWKVV